MSARRAVAVRHVAFEDLGLLEPILRRRGFEIRYVEAGVDDLVSSHVRDAELLVVLGGPVGVNDRASFPFLVDACRLVEGRLGARKPILGICLGAQLLARALGARVYPAGGVEIGWAPVSLTEAGLRSPLRHLDDPPAQVLHWHGDTFDLPAGAAHLASTSLCPNQAFSIDRSLALQFHLEVEARQIDRWLIGHVCELAHHGIDIDRLRHATREIGPAVRPACEAVFESWLDEAMPEAMPEAMTEAMTEAMPEALDTTTDPEAPRAP